MEIKSIRGTDISLLPRRTVWGSLIQTANYTRGRISWVEFTTLNEKYSVGNEVAVGANELPALEYFGVGRGSTYMKIMSDGSSESRNYVHEPLNASLFFPMPFVMRTFDNDLSVAERRPYACRVLMPVNGINYIAYMLKELDRNNTEVVGQIVIPATDDTPKSVKPIKGDIRYLNPKPIEPSAGNVATNNAYTNISSVMLSTLTAWDIAEMINAKTILTGNAQLEITEVGLFSALRKTMTSPSNIGASPIEYTEAIRAQLNVVTSHRILINKSEGRSITIEHDLGVSDPTTFKFQYK